MCMTNLLICTFIHLHLLTFFKKAHKHAYPPNGHWDLKASTDWKQAGSKRTGAIITTMSSYSIHSDSRLATRPLSVCRGLYSSSWHLILHCFFVFRRPFDAWSNSQWWSLLCSKFATNQTAENSGRVNRVGHTVTHQRAAHVLWLASKIFCWIADKEEKLVHLSWY